ncbi:MAG: hypothetical protein LBQ61_06735 [Spirochaetales bacterium]|jgi:hypothetical protein|nr:hypothetical protein [Spirochaetales bacterium]
MKNCLFAFLTLSLVLTLGSCSSRTGASPAQTPPEAVTTASVWTNAYTNLDQAAVLQAMGRYQGICTVATVNADGSPNVAIFIPGVADDSHLMFGWADNATKANFLRTKTAELVYDVVNLGADTKEGRHQGAVLKIVPEEDAAVLEQIKAALPEALAANFSAFVICRIIEVNPVG